MAWNSPEKLRVNSLPPCAALSRFSALEYSTSSWTRFTRSCKRQSFASTAFFNPSAMDSISASADTLNQPSIADASSPSSMPAKRSRVAVIASISRIVLPPLPTMCFTSVRLTLILIGGGLPAKAWMAVVKAASDSSVFGRRPT